MSGVLEAELATFARNLELLEREHHGKFVVVHGDEIVDTFDTFQAAADEALRRFGDSESYLIRQIKGAPIRLSPAILMGALNANSAGSGHE